MTTRRVKATSLLPPLKFVEDRVLSGVLIPPVIIDESLLVTRKGSLEAINEKTGVTSWTVPLSQMDELETHGGAPLLIDGFVLVRSGNELFKIELATGSFEKHPVGPRLDLYDGAFSNNCIVSLGVVSELNAWDLNQRALRWSFERDFVPTPLVSFENIVVGGEMGCISAYDIWDGKQVWSIALDSDAMVGALAITPTGSLIAANSPEIIGVEVATGEVLWRTITDIVSAETMAVTEDGEIHLLDLLRYRRLSAASGRDIFSTRLKHDQLPAIRGVLGRIAVSNTHVFAGDLRGPLIAVSREGEVDWKWEEERPRAASVAPVLSDERLYALTFDGTLQCFERST
jgi:outer membrane protein assembly factor BamB